MKEIELTIKIYEEQYEHIQNMTMDEVKDYHVLLYDICERIKNGTPLPKGHGDLKDMDDIYETLEGWDKDTAWIVDAIDDQTQTIIEADKESEE